MIYLDTSAFIKLYLNEEGSTKVHGLVVGQDEPLPVWHLTEVEFHNALRFKIYLKELVESDVDRLLSLYFSRKAAGQYHNPYLDPLALHESSIEMTKRTRSIGSRSLDILHVAAARLLAAAPFVTGDERQGDLARAEGLETVVV